MFFLLQDQARFSHNYFSTTRYFSAGIDDSSYNCSFVLCNKANLICTSYVCFWDMLWFSVCPSCCLQVLLIIFTGFLRVEVL